MATVLASKGPFASKGRLETAYNGNHVTSPLGSQMRRVAIASTSPMTSFINPDEVSHHDHTARPSHHPIVQAPKRTKTRGEVC